MKRINQIQLLASGLLTIPESRLPSVLDEINQQVAVDELVKPHWVSVGATDTHGKESTLVDWSRALRQETIQQIRFFYGTDRPTSLPQLRAADFNLPPAPWLQVTTARTSRTYQLGLVLCPEYQITPRRFIELIRAQPHAQTLWDRVTGWILEANAMNQRPVVSPDRMDAYLLTRAGADVFNGIAGELIRKVQIEAYLLDTPLQVPAHLQAFLVKSDLFDVTGTAPVQLYAVQEVTPAQLRVLIDAQPPAGQVWSRYATAQQDSYLDIPPPTATELEPALDGLSFETVSMVVSVVFQCICDYCRETATEPVIPTTLIDYFGPDEAAIKRTEARARLQANQWYLAGNEHPWELYLFEEFDYPPVLTPLVSLETARQTLQTALVTAENGPDFAGNPFAETFRLTRYLLSEIRPTGPIDEQHLATLLADLQQRGFSEFIQEYVKLIFLYAVEAVKLDWTPERMYGFWAINLIDSYGNQGSWSDQYYDGLRFHQTYGEGAADYLRLFRTSGRLCCRVGQSRTNPYSDGRMGDCVTVRPVIYKQIDCKFSGSCTNVLMSTIPEMPGTKPLLLCCQMYRFVRSYWRRCTFE